MSDYVCGVDVGTSAVRVMACDRGGRVAAVAAVDLPEPHNDGPRREQDPESWWRAVVQALKQVTAKVDPACIRAVAVDATSGTLVLTDAAFRPVGPGIMYNDARAAGYADRINGHAEAFIRRHGYRFKDDFSLSKLLWMKDHDPAFKAARWVLHQSDFINARLLGDCPPTDWSNALKTGADLWKAGWPSDLFAVLEVPVDRLPARVVAPGTVVGTVCARAAGSTGLSAGTLVVTGASDGTASLFASGACVAGDFNTALGSTVTIKGITRDILHDPEGVLYCHRHPAGYWLPGGAGNVGCAALNRTFAPDPGTRRVTLQRLDASLKAHVPSPLHVYPLGTATDERFPFKKRGISTIRSGPADSVEADYAAHVQAIAFVERWCYEKVESLGGKVVRILSTGGGSRSEAWCRLRADVLKRPLVVPEQTETAFGSAILAAGGWSGDLAAASKSMAGKGRVVEPGGQDYEPAYRGFRDFCRDRWGV